MWARLSPAVPRITPAAALRLNTRPHPWPATIPPASLVGCIAARWRGVGGPLAQSPAVALVVALAAQYRPAVARYVLPAVVRVPAVASIPPARRGCTITRGPLASRVPPWPVSRRCGIKAPTLARRCGPWWRGGRAVSAWPVVGRGAWRGPIRASTRARGAVVRFGVLVNERRPLRALWRPVAELDRQRGRNGRTRTSAERGPALRGWRVVLCGGGGYVASLASLASLAGGCGGLDASGGGVSGGGLAGLN